MDQLIYTSLSAMREEYGADAGLTFKDAVVASL